MDNKPRIIIVEGIDRLGKSTFIENLQQKLGYYQTIHLDKPKKLECYNNSLQKYQQESYYNFFDQLENAHYLIYDRGHLGECVYAPLYRQYSGDYVFKMEQHIKDDPRIKLVLFTTDNFELIEDDGESFNFDNKEREQEMFIEAFRKSGLVNKQIINVHNGDGFFKHPDHIIAEFLAK